MRYLSNDELDVFIHQAVKDLGNPSTMKSMRISPSVSWERVARAAMRMLANKLLNGK